MISVAETGEFRRKASCLLSEGELEALVFYLACHPAAGVLIRETGGLRKLRWGSGGSGKRGGSRVIYYFHSERMPLYLLTVYAKGEQSDLTAADRRQFKALVETLQRANGL